MSAKILLVSDFDGTLTLKDTTPLSFQSKYSFINGTKEERELLTKDWNERGDSYVNGYGRVLKGFFAHDYQRNYKGLEDLMKILDDYSVESRRILAKRNIFADVVYDSVEYLVSCIQFYENSKETLKYFNCAEKKNVKCKILSVNWFPQLIHKALENIIAKDDIVAAKTPIMKDGNTDDLGESSTSFQKLQWIEKWKSDEKVTVVYVGDSLTDSLALLAATYGILFGASEITTKVIKGFGIDLIPLVQRKSYKSDAVKQLYVTQCWRDVKDFINCLVNTD